MESGFGGLNGSPASYITYVKPYYYDVISTRCWIPHNPGTHISKAHLSMVSAHPQAPLILKRCLDGRGAAGGALALVCTQLPFPYACTYSTSEG